MGRPSTYTEEAAESVCSRIANSKEGLRKICGRDGLPGVDAVLKWLKDRPDFAARYARAKEEQADFLAEEIIEIADDTTEDAQSRRVRIDTRKWLAGKLRPKVYGDKLDLSGETTVTIRPDETMTQDEATRAYRSMVQSSPVKPA